MSNQVEVVDLVESKLFAAADVVSTNQLIPVSSGCLRATKAHQDRTKYRTIIATKIPRDVSQVQRNEHTRYHTL